MCEGVCHKIRQQTFPYPVFGRFSYMLSALVGRTIFGFCQASPVGDFERLSANIRRHVREQPDTGYWKSLLSYFVTDPFTLWGRKGGYNSHPRQFLKSFYLIRVRIVTGTAYLKSPSARGSPFGPITVSAPRQSAE